MKGLSKNFRFKVGLDVDDVLLPCSMLAIEWANRDYKLNPPLTLQEIKSWNPTGGRTDIIYQYFHNEEFFKSQRPLEGAVEFVKKLSKKAEVFFVTAVDPLYMGIRAEQLQKYFPDVPAKNYIPAYRKDIVDLDFLLDDGAHNIISSNVKYPVLFRRPWNAGMTGLLSVNTYDEFLNLVDCIKESYLDSDISFRKPTVVALVGPSGSGKTAIANELLKNDRFMKPDSATTRKPRAGEESNSYHFVSNEEFEKMKSDQMFAETTVYAGESYGSELASINSILKNGKHCVIPIDISGAMALKMQYRTCIIYIKREKPDLIMALTKRVQEKKMSEDEMVRRIVSLEDEKRNKELCDYVLVNDGTIPDAAQRIFDTMRIK